MTSFAADDTTSEPDAMPRGPSLWRRLVGWAVRIALGLVALVVAATLLFAVVPPVSTLMIGRFLTLQPVTRDWTPLAEMGRVLPRTVLASEDARFCLHGGVDWAALGDVLDTRGGPRRGASTISMQVAKNLFLWPSRSYIRKGLEIPLALWLDLVWSKRRMLEVYLNIAEWGPDGQFGVTAGAARAFSKPVARLSPREAALLVAALPNPIIRDPKKPSRAQARLAGIVAARARSGGMDLSCLE